MYLSPFDQTPAQEPLPCQVLEVDSTIRVDDQPVLDALLEATLSAARPAADQRRR